MPDHARYPNLGVQGFMRDIEADTPSYTLNRCIHRRDYVNITRYAFPENRGDNK